MILGIDPGLDGALAFYDPRSGALEVQDMPTVSFKRRARARGGEALFAGIDEDAPEAAAPKSAKARLVRRVDAAGLAGAILVNGEVDVAFVEFVSASPQMGVTSAFNFGCGYGQVLGVLAGRGIPYTAVPPAVWKVRLSVPREKSAARARASQLLPKHAHLWPLAKHDGRAEAALIALYGSKNL